MKCVKSESEKLYCQVRCSCLCSAKRTGQQMKLHRMCSMSGKSHQSNGSSELSPSVPLQREVRGGEDASDCVRQRLVSGGGLEAKCPTDTGLIGSVIAKPQEARRCCSVTRFPLVCLSVLDVCGGFELRQTLFWWTKGRMIIRKTLPSAGQKTSS